MAIPLSELVKDLKPEDVLLDLQTVGALLGLPAYALQSGKPAGQLLSVFANQFSKLWNKYPAPWMRSAFLDYAVGDWLTLRAATRYKRYRTDQTFAVGTVVIENRGGGFYTVTAGNVRAKNTAGKTFTNTTGGTLSPWLGSGAYPSLSLTVRADEAGAASNTPSGGILAHPTPLVQGWTDVFARTNAGALLGSDAETDVHLVDRCRLATGPLSPGGPRSAYESIALDVRRNVAGDPVLPEPIGTDAAAYEAATPLSITRVKVRELGGNVLDVLLASDAGAASGDEATPGSDVFVASTAIQLWAVPAGMTVGVRAAIEIVVAIGVITLYVDRKSLVTKEEAEADARAALLDYFKVFPIGGQKRTPGAGLGTLFKSAVEATAMGSNRGIFDCNAATFSDVTFAATYVVVPTYTVLAIVVTQ